MTQEQIDALVDGDEIHVFDTAKDKYIKRTVEVGKNGHRYVWGDPRGYFKTRDTISINIHTDCVTAEELPAAKKRHAERRKAEKAAEDARKQRERDARALRDELFGVGVGSSRNGVLEAGNAYRDGTIRVDLTIEQASALLRALNGSDHA